MSALLGLLLNPTVLGILAGIIGFFGYGKYKEHVGAKKVRAEQAKRDAAAREERHEMDREATDAERKAAELSDAAAREEALKWRRS